MTGVWSLGLVALGVLGCGGPEEEDMGWFDWLFGAREPEPVVPIARARRVLYVQGAEADAVASALAVPRPEAELEGAITQAATLTGADGWVAVDFGEDAHPYTFHGVVASAMSLGAVVLGASWGEEPRLTYVVGPDDRYPDSLLGRRADGETLSLHLPTNLMILDPPAKTPPLPEDWLDEVGVPAVLRGPVSAWPSPRSLTLTWGDLDGVMNPALQAVGRDDAPPASGDHEKYFRRPPSPFR